MKIISLIRIREGNFKGGNSLPCRITVHCFALSSNTHLRPTSFTYYHDDNLEGDDDDDDDDNDDDDDDAFVN